MVGGEGVALAWAEIGGQRREFTAQDLPQQQHAEKLEKFVEDVKSVKIYIIYSFNYFGFHQLFYFVCRYGIYPLTAYGRGHKGSGAVRAASPPEAAESVKSVTPEPLDIETRRITNMMCSIKAKDPGEVPELTVRLATLQ